MFGPEAVLGLLAILAHQDYRRLNGRQAGKHQVEQDVRIGIEGFGYQQPAIDAHPAHQQAYEESDEGPTAAEVGQPVGLPLPKGQTVLELFVNIPGRDFFLFETLRHLLFQIINFLAGGFENLGDVSAPEEIQIGQANKAFSRPFWVFFPGSFRRWALR